MSASSAKFSAKEKKLIRRYLIWCYKTTKESLEKIDRKATQLAVDSFIFDQINKIKWPHEGSVQDQYQKLIHDFKDYIDKKENDYNAGKFIDSRKINTKPDYLYLQNRLASIEKAIVHFLGASELAQIEDLYEEEMTQRILQSRDYT